MIAFTDEMNDAMLPRITQMNIDHQTLFKPITKWTTRLKQGRVKETLYKALEIATSEVPGPVHVGLPLGLGLLEEPGVPDRSLYVPRIPEAEEALLNKGAEIFSKAKKPVIALGITAVRSDIRDMIIDLVEKFNIPVVLTPMAKGMIPEEHRCYAGVQKHGAPGSLFGVPLLTVEDKEQYSKALETVFAAKGPVIIEAHIDTKDYDDLVLKGNY